MDDKIEKVSRKDLAKTSLGQSTADIFHSFSRLIYMIDTSGSMEQLLEAGKWVTKMEAVKQAAKGFLEKRLAENPKASVFLYSFESHPQLVFYGNSLDDLVRALDRLQPGSGTEIFTSLRAVVEECIALSVGVNHIVMVSDGMDASSIHVPLLLEEMQLRKIVFDFIYVKQNRGFVYQKAIDAMQATCLATCGEFVQVETLEEFNQKFLVASERKALPPGMNTV